MAKNFYRFLATIYKIWMTRHVDVPEEVSAALIREMAKARKNGAPQNVDKRSARRDSTGSKAAKLRYIPVVVIVDGRSARVTLVPAGGGRYRMKINTALRKAAGVDAGDLASVELRLDLASRELPVPPDLRAGLKAIPKAQKAFEALTPAHRRHIIQYFDSAKSAEARRRLERAIDVLLERAFLQPRRSAKRRRSRSAA